MRIVTWNVNGLRAALKKGFADAVNAIEPDILLLQEIRVQLDQLADCWVRPKGWHTCWHPGDRKGYSGTAIWSKRPLSAPVTGMDGPDIEGRVIRARVDDLLVVNIYLPSGSAGDHRQQQKELWMAELMPWLNRLLAANDGPIVLGGDINIAHTEKDIFYAKSNEKNSGFLPHERQWFGDLLSSGWHDFIRRHYGDIQGPYSWWSNRGRARELDRGWRIDYLLGNDAAKPRFRGAQIHRQESLTISDHAPVSIDLE